MARFVVTEVGLELRGRGKPPPIEDWLAEGRRIANDVKRAMFRLGDWLNIGEKNYGEQYAQGMAITGLSYKTLANSAWTAGKIESSRRRELLEWWPHYEVAGLEVADQEVVLAEVCAFVDGHPANDHPRRSDVRDWVRLRKREMVVTSLAEMEGKYRVVYADPPWQYNDSGASTEGSFGKAEDHYPCMPTEDIAAIPVEAHVRPNSVLFCWVTSPMLFEAKAVFDGWGFIYKTGMVWDKDAHVVGNYVSVQHEHLLIATRGSCCPRPEDLTPMIDSVQTVKLPKRRHSEKPAIFREHIERLYPRGPRIELFARREVEEWVCYGNQIGSQVRTEKRSATA